LNFPEQILSERVPEQPRRSALSPTACLLAEKLLDVKRRFSSIADQYGEEVLLQFTRPEWGPIGSTIEAMDKAWHGFKCRIDGIRTRAGLE
jgi:hypothetical protein